jgi:hypothetical protein
MTRHIRRTFVCGATGAALALFGVSGAAGKGPVRSDKACSLIAPAELDRAIGATPGDALVGMEIPFTKDATHDHDGSLFTCQGKVGDRFVLVTFGSKPVTREGRKRAEERVARSQDELRKKGYTIHSDGRGGIECWTMAAPPGDASAQAMFGTTCGGEKGANFYSITVSANSTTEIIPIAKLRALAETAAARLP